MSRMVVGNKTLLLLTSRPVEPRRERKSVGKEVTFERDLVDRNRMEGILGHLAVQVERSRSRSDGAIFSSTRGALAAREGSRTHR